MGRFVRLIGLAAFCLVFGFIGSLGGLWVLNGHLRGARGPAGPAGVAGPVGPTGARGPAFQSTVPHLANVIMNLENEDRLLSSKLSTLEQAGTVPAAQTSCVPTPVVADVQPWVGAQQFRVMKTTVCLPPG